MVANKYNIKDFILVSIIVGLLLFILIFRKSGQNSVVKQVEDNHRIDSLSSLNKIKDDSILILKIDNYKLDSSKKELVIEYENNLKRIKKIKNEKIKKDSIVNSSSVHDIQRFLSERYNES